jgi:hypothetical protein
MREPDDGCSGLCYYRNEIRTAIMVSEGEGFDTR